MQDGARVGCRADEQRRPGPAVAGIIRVERGAGQSQDGAGGGVGGRADKHRIGVKRVVAGRGQVELAVVYLDIAQIGRAAREVERIRAQLFKADEREVACEGKVLVAGVEAEGGGAGCREDRLVGQGRELRGAEAVGGGAGGDAGDEGAGVGNGEARSGLRAQRAGGDGVEVALRHGGGAGVGVGRVEKPKPALALFEQAAVSADGAGDGGGAAGKGIEARRAGGERHRSGPDVQVCVHVAVVDAEIGVVREVQRPQERGSHLIQTDARAGGGVGDRGCRALEVALLKAEHAARDLHGRAGGHVGHRRPHDGEFAAAVDGQRVAAEIEAAVAHVEARGRIDGRVT